ncbi:MAG: PHP domain-containing protein [Dehalococcoidia bacterium]|jgi:predicted metal-dependent phosphoesterase TrpH|nr:MAG: hypothetical protein DK305_001109 [Chloroflexota bacterium]
MSIGDFHCHSNNSDGILKPTQLVKKAKKNGVKYLAITDHDSISGIHEAKEIAKEIKGITIIPGIELSIDVLEEDVHILGIFIDEKNPELINKLKKLRKARINRAKELLIELKKDNIIIDWQLIKRIAGNATIGRPHIARAMVELDYVKSVQEAFNEYLSKDRYSKIKREKLELKNALEIIHNSGGISVLAHPTLIKKFDAVLKLLIQSHLDGIEIYYKNYSKKIINKLLKVSIQKKLIALGGSDYHGIHGNQEKEPGNIPFPNEIVERLIKKYYKENQ